MSDAELRYTFTCPNCTGNFSITLDRVPPVQARFRCPHCKKPMDFPSRDEARVYARLQKQEAAAGGMGTGKPVLEEAPAAPDAPAAAGNAQPAENARFKILKHGYEDDVFDRRGLRNLIRTGAVTEHDLVSVNDGEGSPAGELPYLKSLFGLRKSSTAEPPPCCRTHPEKVAFFQCTTSARPLCEDCAPEKKFGGTIIRVCQHCGGTANELASAPAS